MPTHAHWNGTEEESWALVSVITRNCVCQFSPGGALVTVCALHRSLIDDQKFLDGLLCGRSRRAQLLAQEFLGDFPE